MVVHLRDVEDAHDRFLLLGRAYAAAPSPDLAGQVERAYRRFWIAYTGSVAGFTNALADLRRKMQQRAAA